MTVILLHNRRLGSRHFPITQHGCWECQAWWSSSSDWAVRIVCASCLRVWTVRTLPNGCLASRRLR